MSQKNSRSYLIAAATVLGLLCIPSVAQASGNVDLFAGQKELDTDFGGGNDIEEQDAVALFLDFGQEEWPVHVAVDLLTGSRDTDDDDFDVDLDGSTGEIGVGARWYPAKGSRWMPHLGGGLGLVSGEVKTSNPNPSNDISFDDSKLGYWADTGLAYRLADHFKLGARVRYSKAKLDNPGGDIEEVEAGGLTYGVSAGWSW
jgi:opacity protein-like surface antigen